MKRIFAIISCVFFSVAVALASDDIARINHFDERDGFTESYVTCVIQDKEGFIWVSSWNGLSLYDGYRFVTFKGRPGDGCPLETNRINSIVEMPDHNILCKSNNRYYIFDRHRKTFKAVAAAGKRHLFHTFHPSARAKDRIKAMPEYRDIEVKFLCEDRQGGIWIQSNRGLERVRFVRRPLVTEKYGSDGEESIRGLFLDRHNRLWIADKNGIVRVLENYKGSLSLLHQSCLFLDSGGSLTTVPTSFGANVYCFCEDSEGNIWMGTKPDGLYRLKPNGINKYYVSHYTYHREDKWSISDNSVYDIVDGGNGTLFVATFHGGLNVAVRKDDSVRFLNNKNVLTSYPKEALQSRCLLKAGNNMLLVGTTNGLVVCRIGKSIAETDFLLSRRNPEQRWTLSSNYIMGLLLLHNGSVLIATSGGGIDKIEKKSLLGRDFRYEHFSSSQGLSSDMTLALCEDIAGKVWVVSEASLSRVDIQRREVMNFSKGLFSGSFAFTEVPPVCLPDGHIIIGTTQGTLSFNTLSMTKSSFVPNIVFNCGDIIDVDADTKEFSIRFAALDYNKEEDIVYAYRLDGVDTAWHYTTANELHYVGLRPGNYMLHVKSTNGDGVWVNNERVISIHKDAKFSETPYSWILAGIFIALVFFALYKVVEYIRRLQREIKDITLTSNEKIALLGERLRELLPGEETMEKADTSSDNDSLSEAEREFAGKVKNFVRDNIANSDLGVQSIADAMFVSRTVLFVKVKRIFKCSPNNLILNMRIELAKELLSTDSASIAEVAYRCGFSDPKYFSRCFKKLTGKRPTEYKH